MKTQLQSFCHSINIEYVGIAPIGPYLDLQQRIEARKLSGQYTEFEEKCLAKRIDPSLTMPEVESVIVCLFPYYNGDIGKGNVAKYAYTIDYHKIVKEKLTAIGDFLTEHIDNFHYQAFVDNGPLVDRYVAYLAGIGFYGLNSHIITDKYGSYVVIGYMLTNYPFAVDKPLQRSCMQCGRCVAACPGQAIVGDFAIDPRNCRSYLTQKKDELTMAQQKIMTNNNLIFGCDICQDVCPHNKQVAVTILTEFKEDLVLQLTYEELAAISNKEFMRRYKNRAFSWRGRKLLVRNFELNNKD